ncbi:putative transporter (major facilitator superfamily) [Fusarium austroafricanum]|uniref:Putative transporter (Major facilitator superfamily) n=1 Tax=Fusarium austroafricanum TaxID=2364996 RepID=A0A8H4K7L8_9HYPO|nr:putative transporter (major facilitator superfamily) [Fusarium austroafricanum]
MGGFTFGFDSGIIATTFGHQTFRVYMYGPSQASTSLAGAIVSCYNAGQAIGAPTVGYLADRFSRKYTIAFASFLAILGASLQAGAVHVGMMIAGRLIAGLACGQFLAVVPTYIAEVAKPSQRGFMVGLQGLMTAIGFCIANWAGYGGAFAVGNAQWRIPLAMQIPVPFILMFAVFFVPFSPRWLITKGRHEEARRVLSLLHDTEGETFIEQELTQIQQQVELEASSETSSWSYAIRKLFSLQYLRRTLLAAFIICQSQLSGASVIQNFQNTFYAIVGITGKQSLLVSGLYGFMGVLGTVIYLVFVADKWPRVRTLWTGSLALSVAISICMALSATYGKVGEVNMAGARASIAFIFIYSATFAVFFNAMIWVVPSELFPTFLRSKGMAFAVSSKSVVAIVLSQITPLALAEVSWRFYALFIACNTASAVLYFFFLPETGGKTLEEIAELFGDVVATDIHTNEKLDAASVVHAEREAHK